MSFLLLIVQFSMKYYFISIFYVVGSKRVKNTTSLEAAKSVFECIEILQDEQLFTQKDVIFMQFLCQETDCLELFRICKDFAVEEKALCYFKTELGNVKSYYAYLLQRNIVVCNLNNTLYFIKLVCFAMRNWNEMLWYGMQCFATRFKQNCTWLQSSKRLQLNILSSLVRFLHTN